MYSNQFLASALTVLAATIPSVVGQYSATCAYFVQYTGSYLVTERVDPLLSPGVASNHVHSIAGGNGFNADMTFADTQKSTCTTAQVTQDKGNYWMPVLYFQNGGKFYKVPEAGNRKIYYKFGNNDCSYDQERSEFPQGFRMITGSATQRVANTTLTNSAGNQMSWQCHDGSANYPTGVDGAFPTGFQSCNAPDVPGLAASMRFPSCWNGNDFNIQEPLAHMAFPTNQDGLAGCLAPFNVKRFPEIFIEFYYNISQFDSIQKDYSDPNNPPWVLADGDPTGYSMHMDFINGWVPGTLAQAIKTCHIADGGSDPIKKIGLASDACFGVASAGVDGYQDSAVSGACYLDPIVTPTEDIGLTGNALAKLPGCNPIQTVQPAVIHPPSSCGAATGVSGGSGGSPPAANETSDMTTATAATGAASTVASDMASSVAVTEKYANPVSTAPSSAAYVAPVASSPAESQASSSTGTPSTGPGSTPAQPQIPVKSGSSAESWEYQGCYTDLIPDRNVRSLSIWGEGDSSTSCANHCFAAGYSIAGTEYGSQCFCGNSMTSTSKMSDGDCNTACTGAASEMCGGSSRMSVYAKSGTSLTKKRSAHAHRHAMKRRGSSF